jgi:hypothetical protein
MTRSPVSDQGRPACAGSNSAASSSNCRMRDQSCRAQELASRRPSGSPASARRTLHIGCSSTPSAAPSDGLPDAGESRDIERGLEGRLACFGGEARPAPTRSTRSEETNAVDSVLVPGDGPGRGTATGISEHSEDDVLRGGAEDGATRRGSEGEATNRPTPMTYGVLLRTALSPPWGSPRRSYTDLFHSSGSCSALPERGVAADQQPPRPTEGDRRRLAEPPDPTQRQPRPGGESGSGRRSRSEPEARPARSESRHLRSPRRAELEQAGRSSTARSTSALVEQGEPQGRACRASAPRSVELRERAEGRRNARTAAASPLRPSTDRLRRPVVG